MTTSSGSQKGAAMPSFASRESWVCGSVASEEFRRREQRSAFAGGSKLVRHLRASGVVLQLLLLRQSSAVVCCCCCCCC